MESEMIQISSKFNTFTKIFIHLNVNALLMYKTRELFSTHPQNPWIVIPIYEIRQVQIVNMNQALPQHIWEGIEA